MSFPKFECQVQITVCRILVYLGFRSIVVQLEVPFTDRARCPADMAIFPGNNPDLLTVSLAAGATDTRHLWDHCQCVIDDMMHLKQLTGIVTMVCLVGLRIEEEEGGIKSECRL